MTLSRRLVAAGMVTGLAAALFTGCGDGSGTAAPDYSREARKAVPNYNNEAVIPNDSKEAREAPVTGRGDNREPVTQSESAEPRKTDSSRYLVSNDSKEAREALTFCGEITRQAYGDSMPDAPAKVYKIDYTKESEGEMIVLRMFPETSPLRGTAQIFFMRGKGGPGTGVFYMFRQQAIYDLFIDKERKSLDGFSFACENQKIRIMEDGKTLRTYECKGGLIRNILPSDSK